jgi:hypothetical protein
MVLWYDEESCRGATDELYKPQHLNAITKLQAKHRLDSPHVLLHTFPMLRKALSCRTESEIDNGGGSIVNFWGGPIGILAVVVSVESSAGDKCALTWTLPKAVQL